MGTLTHSPKDAPPPPQPPTSVSFVAERPPTPPPLPHFTSPIHHSAVKHVRIDPKPPVELPPPASTHSTPSQSSVPDASPIPGTSRTPLRTLSPLRNSLSLAPSSSSDPPKPTSEQPKQRQPLFGFFARQTSRDPSTAHPSTIDSATSDHKQNAAPLNIADLSNPPQNQHPPQHSLPPLRNIDENNKPLAELCDASSDDSATHQVPRTPNRALIVDQIVPQQDKPQRAEQPFGRDKRFAPVPNDDESMETTESEKYKDCESPDIQPRRRVEIFRRFRFVQDGRQRPEQLSDFVQTTLPEKPQAQQLPAPSPPPVVSVIPKARVAPPDPVSHREDMMSFTSDHEDGERSSDERPPPAMRDIRKHSRMRVKSPRPLELEPKILEEEKGHLPHVESITTSSSSNSKETTESPSVGENVLSTMQETSAPYAQAEMPHLLLGKGKVTAHAFLSGPSPSKMAKVAHIRRDSHAGFLNKQSEPKLEEIKYGGHTGERETAPLGGPPPDAGATDGGEIKRTRSGLQRMLKEAGAELVNKAKKIPRGSSFSKLRSNSLKDLRRSSSAKGSKAERAAGDKTPQRTAKDSERSKSLPRDSVQGAPKPAPVAAKVPVIEKKPVATKDAEEKKESEQVTKPTTPGVPEFVTIKRVIRRVRRDGTEELVTKRVRVKPERVLPNGDVVIKRTMKRTKDDGSGTETLTVLQVIPRRKNGKSCAHNEKAEDSAKGDKDIASLPALAARQEDKETPELGAKTAQNMYDEGPFGRGERSGSFAKRRSSSRSKTDMVDEGGRWRRARSFGRVRGESTSKGEKVSRQKTDHRIGVVDGVKGLLPRSKSGSRVGDRETAGLGCNDDGKGWLRKKSLPRVMSFHGRHGKRKESGASNKSEGSWWPFRR